MKIIALGAWGPNSYFSDGWNTFDFCVVVLCYINYVPNSGNATALRALRALRPLRSFGLVPQLRKTFNGILNVLMHTARVEIVDWFLMFVVTLVAVQLFSGQMSGGCFYKDPNFDASDYMPPAPTRLNIASNTAGVQANTAYSVMPGYVRTRLINNLFYNADFGYGMCALDARSEAFQGTNMPTLAAFAPAPPACPPVTVDFCPPVAPATVGAYNAMGACTAPLQQIVVQQQCVQFQNPMSWGASQLGMSYDNVGIGFLTTYMAESEEGWTSVVYTLWNTFGANWFISLFFIALVLIVDDFVSVMTDANTWMAFSESMRDQAAETAHNNLAENVKVSRDLEKAALDEMWGVNPSRDPAARERASIIFWHNAGAALYNGLGALYNLFPAPPALVKACCGRIEKLWWFDNFFLAIVMANIVSLAVDGSHIPDEMSDNLRYVNYSFVALFVVELIVRLCTHGMRKFCEDGFNAFDFIIVAMSVVEIIISNALPDLGSVGLSGVRVLRVFRVFRAFKLARGWKQLNTLLGTLVRAIPGVSAIFSILFVLILVFTAIGMQIFGGLYQPAIDAGMIDEYPRNNFDFFGWGMVSVFQIIEGENWFVPLYQHMAVLGPVAALFFVALNVMGNLVFGLVVAVFMQGFDEEEEEEVEAELHEQVRKAAEKAEAAARSGKLAATGQATTTFKFNKNTHRAMQLVIDLPPRGLAPPAGIADAGADDLLFDGRDVAMRVTFTPGVVKCVGVDQASGKIFDPSYLANESTAFDASTLKHAADSDKALFLCAPKNGLRVMLAKLTTSKAFEWFSFAVTILSCVNLALGEPWLDYCSPNDGTCTAMKDYLNGCDAFVVAWFTLEMVLKVIAQGFFPQGVLGGTAHGYLSSQWNVIDFIIVVASIAGLAAGMTSIAGAGLTAIRSIRGIRVLRVLRLIKQFTAITLISDVIVAMIPGALNASVLIFLFIYIFAIIGMQTFGGTENICNDFSVFAKADCTGKFALSGPNCAFLPTQALENACKAAGNSSTFMMDRRWEAQLPNWDNFGNALLQTYMIADGENWPTFMYNAVDGALHEGDGMSRDNNQWNAIFFVLCIVIMDCVALDLFSGVVKVTYRHLVTKSGGRGYLTNGQRKLVDNTVLVFEAKPHTKPAPPANENSVAAVVFNTIHEGAFHSIMGVVVLANVLVVAMHRYPEDALTNARLNSLHYLFVLVFAAEAGAGLFADGVAQYFNDSWNIFNFCTCVGAIVGAGLNLAAEANAGGGRLDFGVMRISLTLMSLRFFFTVRSWRKSKAAGAFHMVQPVAKAIWAASFRVFQCCLFFSVCIFMYAIVGMAAFGNTRHGYAGDGLGGNPARSSGNLNADANFESFPKAIFTLYRTITGENWCMLLLDMSQDAPYCQNAGDVSDNCGDYIFAPIFWISYKMLTDMVLDSLLTAIVLDAFWLQVEPAEKWVGWEDLAGRRLFHFSHHHSEQFADAWQDVCDPYGNAAGATRAQLAEIVLRLDAPMGLKAAAGASKASEAEAAAFVDALPLPLVHSADPVPFHMALHAIVSAASLGHEFGVSSGKAVVAATETSHILQIDVVESPVADADADAAVPEAAAAVAAEAAAAEAAAAPAPASSEASRGEEAKAEE